MLLTVTATYFGLDETIDLQLYVAIFVSHGLLASVYVKLELRSAKCCPCRRALEGVAQPSQLLLVSGEEGTRGSAEVQR